MMGDGRCQWRVWPKVLLIRYPPRHEINFPSIPPPHNPSNDTFHISPHLSQCTHSSRHKPLRQGVLILIRSSG